MLSVGAFQKVAVAGEGQNFPRGAILQYYYGIRPPKTILNRVFFGCLIPE